LSRAERTSTQQAGRPGPASRRGQPPKPGPRSKRDQILDVATDYFGRYGYEDTKWADVAAAVGIGPTALYHYFESKQHCLYEIMSRAVVRARERFDHIAAASSDWQTALVELLEAGFDLTPKDVNEYRVLLAEHGRLEARRATPREEAARKSARARKRQYEAAWAAFLARGMDGGALPRSDPQLLARVLLGLYNSVWTWYRPGGSLSIAEVGRFFVRRELALLGRV
jgi:AcrR family transcriptional regulator